MPTPKKSQLVGLDIGSHSIKLAEIDDSKRGMFLRNFGVIRLPQDAIVEGSIKEMEIVSTAIKNLFRNLKIKNRNVTTSISGYSVIVKKIAIGKRGESELETTIQDEAEQYIPFDINDVNLDYEILSDREGGTSAEGEEEDEGPDRHPGGSGQTGRRPSTSLWLRLPGEPDACRTTQILVSCSADPSLSGAFICSFKNSTESMKLDPVVSITKSIGLKLTLQSKHRARLVLGFVAV